MKIVLAVGAVIAAAISFVAGYTLGNSSKQEEMSYKPSIIAYSDALTLPIESYDEIKTMAENGNANAIAMLYNHYMYTANDRAEAERWILHGAENGIVDYQLDAAEIALQQGDKTQAKKWILKFELNPTRATSMQMDKFYKMRHQLSKSD